MKLKIIKEKLKKIPVIYNLNAFVKARKISSATKKLHKYYQQQADFLGIKYNEEEAVKETKKRLASRGIHPKPRKNLRIFWVGAHYAQDNSGFIQGLKKFGEVLTFKNAKSEYGLYWPSFFDKEAVKSNSDFLLKQVENAHKSAPIDLLMGQMWANVIDPEVLMKIQKMGIPTVNISMDDKIPDLWSYINGHRMGSVGLIKGLDLVLTTSPEACLWYKIESCPVVYWLLASDPSMFYPRGEKIYDIVFVGGKYGERGKLVEKIMSAGISVEAFGPGWPNGFINAEKIAEVFGKAKIILGSGYVAYNKDILTIKLRDFDAPMAGALYITNRNPDLLRIFREGKEIECYDTVEECIQKIKFYLSNPEKLKAVAEAGLKNARENHTWEKRISQALEKIGFN